MTEIRLPCHEGRQFLASVRIDNIAPVKEEWTAKGLEIPPPAEALALIDTGASVSGLSRKLLEALRLPTLSRQRAKFETAGGQAQSHIHFGNLELTQAPGFLIPFVRFVEFEMERMPFEVVIGLPELTKWNFEYHTAEGRLRLWL